MWLEKSWYTSRNRWTQQKFGISPDCDTEWNKPIKEGQQFSLDDKRGEGAGWLIYDSLSDF